MVVVQGTAVSVRTPGVSRLPLLLMCALLPIGCSSSAAKERGDFADRHGRLRVEGLQLTDAAGEAIQLRGVSLFWINWHEENLKPTAVRHIVRNMGATVVRVPVPAFDYARAPATYEAQVSTIVRWIRSEGAYAIIDWHVVDDPNIYREQARKFWRNMARKYRDDPGVLFEICNEPTGVGWPEIKSYARDMLAEIRRHDTSVVVIVGSQEWSRWTKYSALDPLVDDLSGRPVHNVMYAYHGYAATHGMDKDLAGVLEKVPVFATEWGVSEASGDGRQDWAASRRFVEYLRDNPWQKVSWCMWSWVDKRESSALLLPGTGGLSWQLSAAGDSSAVWIREGTPPTRDSARSPLP